MEVTEFDLSVAATSERIRRAILTCDVMPDPERKWLYNTGVLDLGIIQDANEAYGYTEARPPRFRPTPRDIDDMLTCMSWLAWLKNEVNNGKRDYKIIRARAYRVPWWRIGQQFGRHKNTVRRWYDGAVTTIHTTHCLENKNVA